MIMLDRVKMQQLSAWMGFVGIITIIGGVLSALAGVFAFVVGAIPGIIAIVLGVKLRNAKQYAEALLMEQDTELYSGNFNMFVENLNIYFKIQGVLIIISLAMGLLGIIISMIAGFAFYSYSAF